LHVRHHRRHKLAALMGVEGGHAIEDDLRLLRVYFNEGVRYMTLTSPLGVAALTHTNSNHWADSSGDANKPNNGLSPFGKDVVREMNRLGMIVDISHTADKTFWDALETSQAPIFASHSSVRSISDVPRNMTDDMIVALGKKRGVVQINFDCGYLNHEAPRAQLSDVVKHIDKVVDLAGIDSEGLDSVDKWPNLTRALLEEGYSQSDIIKIYGGNTMRLMTEVEKFAAGVK
jgi:membrane dipeptidase